MKYFVLAGWSKKEKKVMYWWGDWDDYYSGWKIGLQNAIILDDTEFYPMMKSLRDGVETTFTIETRDNCIVDIKRIEVKLGEWEDVK